MFFLFNFFPLACVTCLMSYKKCASLPYQFKKNYKKFCLKIAICPVNLVIHNIYDIGPLPPPDVLLTKVHAAP